jgi:uncharacterized membrane protein
MSTCTPDKCPHDSTIFKHASALEMLTQTLAEMRGDIKEVKSVVQVIGAVQIESAHMKDSLARAFSRIEVMEREKAHDHELDAVIIRVKDIEKATERYDAFINQVEGMKSLAWVLWSVLAGGLGVVIMKLFVMTGNMS